MVASHVGYFGANALARSIAIARGRTTVKIATPMVEQATAPRRWFDCEDARFIRGFSPRLTTVRAIYLVSIHVSPTSVGPTCGRWTFKRGLDIRTSDPVCVLALVNLTFGETKTATPLSTPTDRSPPSKVSLRSLISRLSPTVWLLALSRLKRYSLQPDALPMLRFFPANSPWLDTLDLGPFSPHGASLKSSNSTP